MVIRLVDRLREKLSLFLGKKWFCSLWLNNFQINSIIKGSNHTVKNLFFNIGIVVCVCELFRECYALSSTLIKIWKTLTLDNSSDTRDNNLELKIKYLGLIHLTAKMFSASTHVSHSIKALHTSI